MENVVNFKMNMGIDMMEIPVDNVWYDASYQRKINPKRVARMVAEYNPHRMRPIEVSYRDGKYFCWDGQNRTEMYRVLGFEKIPARVHYLLTREDEAYLFAEQRKNESTISKRDEWNARMAAGERDDETKEIVRICSDMGFEITPHVNGKYYQKRKNEIHAVSELQKMYRRYGENGLRITLRVLGEAWNGDYSSTHREIISGLSYILNTYDMTDKQWSRIVRMIKKVTPMQLLRESVSYGKNGHRGGKAVAKCIIEKYLNKGLENDNPMVLNAGFIR